MKAILEFNLPEDREEFELAQKAYEYKAIVDEMWAKLRHYRKYHEWKSVIERRFFDKLDAELGTILRKTDGE